MKICNTHFGLEIHDTVVEGKKSALIQARDGDLILYQRRYYIRHHNREWTNRSRSRAIMDVENYLLTKK